MLCIRSSCTAQAYFTAEHVYVRCYTDDALLQGGTCLLLCSHYEYGYLRLPCIAHVQQEAQELEMMRTLDAEATQLPKLRTCSAEHKAAQQPKMECRHYEAL